MTEPADLEFNNHGSIVTCTPLTERGEEWVAENVATDSWQWLGNSFSIDWRYAADLAAGAIADGLVCV